MTFGYFFPITPRSMPFGLHDLGRKQPARTKTRIESADKTKDGTKTV